MGPLSYAAHRDGVLEHIERARKEGAAVIAGGGRPAADALAHGCYVEPTLISVTRSSRCGGTRCSARCSRSPRPTGSTRRCGSPTTRSTACPPRCSPRQPDRRANKFIELAEAGQVAVNLPTAGWDVHHPFGGFRESGSAVQGAGRARAPLLHPDQDRRREVRVVAASPVVLPVHDAQRSRHRRGGHRRARGRRQLAAAGVPVTVFEKEDRGRHAPDRPQLRGRARRDLLRARLGQGPDDQARRRACCAPTARTRASSTTSAASSWSRGTRRETVKLRELERRSQANGVPGVRWLSGAELRELEPDVAGVAALLSPTTAIVDYPAIARSFAADVTAAGGQVLLGTPVTGLRRARRRRGWRSTRPAVRTRFPAGHLRGPAGRPARREPPATSPAPEIIPFRGEYLRLRPHAAGRVTAAHLPGARPPVPVPRRAPDAARRRHRRPRARTRCSRWPARGTGARDVVPGRPRPAGPVRAPSGGWPRSTG